jgi:hypothetical protein
LPESYLKQNRYPYVIVLITVFLALQWKNIQFSFTEANLLPDNHIVNREYNAFLDKFGEEGKFVGLKTMLFSRRKHLPVE